MGTSSQLSVMVGENTESITDAISKKKPQTQSYSLHRKTE